MDPLPGDGGGFVKLWRKINATALMNSDCKNAKLLFYFLLTNVNWKEREWFCDGKIIHVQPGELVTSLTSLAERNYMTVSEIRTSTNQLVELGMVTRHIARRYTHIKICNWATYQSAEVDDRTTIDTTIARQSHDNRTTIATIEEGKKERTPKQERKFAPKTLAAWSRKPQNGNGNGNHVLDLGDAIPTGSRLCDRYEELVDRWPKNNRTGIDFGCQIWISYVSDGTITDQNVEDVFAGLERWKQSENWTKENGKYIHSIANANGSGGWLKQKLWKDYPAPAQSAEVNYPRKMM